MWKGLVHIRESEAYLSMEELLYNVIAVYIITVLIKTRAKFESHYTLLAVSRPFFSRQVLKFRYSRLNKFVDHIACSYLHCSKLFKDIKGRPTLPPTICNYYYYTIFFLCTRSICRKLTVIYRQLGNTHLIHLL